MFLKKTDKINQNLKKISFKFFILSILLLIFFILGAYSQKTHLFYTTIKPAIFDTSGYFKKIIKGKLQRTDKIYIDIRLDNLKKLNANRKLFLEEQKFIENKNIWLPIDISYNNETFKARIRLKGRDVFSHLDPSFRNKNWSYKIKFKSKQEGNIFGMREFSLMDIRRRGYILEWYARQFLKSENLIYLDYKFVNLFFNGENKGIYAIDESFTESMLTKNNKRSGLGLRFDNDDAGTSQKNMSTYYQNITGAAYDNLFMISEIDLLNDSIESYKLNNNQNQNNLDDTNILKTDKIKIRDFNIASELLIKFRDQKINAEYIFDIDQLAKGFAASDILAGWHGINWTNLSFYFNPISSKLEPIFQDWYNEGFEIQKNNNYRGIRILDVYNHGIFYENIFKSRNFLEKYFYYLHKYTDEDYLKNFDKKINKELNINLNTIYRSSPYYKFRKDLIESQIKFVKRFINFEDPLSITLFSNELKNNDLNKNINIRLGNRNIIPIIIKEITFVSTKNNKHVTIIDEDLKPRKLINMNVRNFIQSPINYMNKNYDIPFSEEVASVVIKYNILGEKEDKFKIVDRPVVMKEITEKIEKNLILYVSNTDTTKSFDFIKKIDDNYIIKKGNWKINKNLFIPYGSKLIIEPGTTLTLTNSAKIISKAQLIAKGTKSMPINIKSEDGRCIILNNNQESQLINVNFYNLQNCNDEAIRSEGSLNIYNSNIFIDNVFFNKNIKGDDAINIVNSQFKINDLRFEDILSDCLDIDFSFGLIKNSKFLNCGNDGLDFSNSSVNINNIFINKTGDKGISAGEQSIINGYNFNIKNTFIGIAAKDSSILNIDNITIENSKYPITAYIKKQSYNSPTINFVNYNNFDDGENLIENGTNAYINNNKYSDFQTNVYYKIYNKN